MQSLFDAFNSHYSMVNLLDTSMNVVHLIFIVRVYHLFFGILHRINEVFATLDIVEGVIIDSTQSNVITSKCRIEGLRTWLDYSDRMLQIVIELSS